MLAAAACGRTGFGEEGCPTGTIEDGTGTCVCSDDEGCPSYRHERDGVPIRAAILNHRRCPDRRRLRVQRNSSICKPRSARIDRRIRL
jgi:hypothetical protein